MKKTLLLLFIPILTTLCVISGCGKNDIHKKIFIGEIYKSEYIYIEPFNKNRDIDNEPFEISEYSNNIKFYTIEKKQPVYNANYVDHVDFYIPEKETNSKYFVQSFSKPKQYTLKYKSDTAPGETLLGITIQGMEIANIDYSVNGQKRDYAKAEYKKALEQVQNDGKIKEEDRTLRYITIEDTIIGAKKICLINIKDSDMKILVSKYNTHGFEYAAKVYVIDIIKGKKVIKTLQKCNWDGPY
ncbi:hypothetical protein ACFL56_02785 [Candidatus Margulisiibacteriota bacterium]